MLVGEEGAHFRSGCSAWLGLTLGICWSWAKRPSRPFFVWHVIYTSTLHIYTSTHLHIYTSAHLHIYTSAHLHIYTSTHLHIDTSTHLHIYTSTHLHIYTSTHLHIYTYTHIHIYTSTHLHIYTSTHLHIYTYTHLHIYTSIFSSHWIAFWFKHLISIGTSVGDTIGYIMKWASDWDGKPHSQEAEFLRLKRCLLFYHSLLALCQTRPGLPRQISLGIYRVLLT